MASTEDKYPISVSSPTTNVKTVDSSPSGSSTINQDGDCHSQLSLSTSSNETTTNESTEQQPNNQEKSSPSSSNQNRLLAIKILRKHPVKRVPVYTTHDCGSDCLDEEKRLNELKSVKMFDHCILINRVNPYCVPLFLGWHRSKSEGWIVYTAPCGKQLNSIRQVHQFLIKTASGLSIDQFTFHYQLKLHTNRDMFKALSYIPDISEGKENIQIPVVNELDSSLPIGTFTYISERIAGKNVDLTSDHEFMSHCDCPNQCKNKDDCSCYGLSRDEAYMISGLDSVNQSGYKYKLLNKKLVSAVFECNSRCTCDTKCLNRVVQHGIKHCLQVFKTPNRGWGVRCLHDIPPGAFICLYAGEIIDFDTVNEIDRINDYIAALDYIEEGRRPKRDFDTASDADSLLGSNSSSSEELSSCEGISNSSIIDDLSDNSDDIDEIGKDPASTADDEQPSCSNQMINGNGPSTSKSDGSQNSCTIILNDSSKRPHSNETEGDNSLSDNSKRPKTDDESVPVIDLEEEFINEVLSTHDLDNEDVIIDFDSMDQSRISSSREGEHGTTIDGSYENHDYSNTINGNGAENGYNGHSGGLDIDPDDMDDDIDNPESAPVILRHLEMTHSYSIDGARYGNVGRFLNHSCEPNCRIRNIFVDNHDYRFPKLAFFSNRLIKAYEELTWDYRYPPDIPYSDSKNCLCGSPLCRGRIY